MYFNIYILATDPYTSHVDYDITSSLYSQLSAVLFYILQSSDRILIMTYDYSTSLSYGPNSPIKVYIIL